MPKANAILTDIPPEKYQPKKNNTVPVQNIPKSQPQSFQGISAIPEPDFGPYMRTLQKDIKSNWHQPKGDTSKRVVVLFKIAKDGKMLSKAIFKSSGDYNTDQAALEAVELTAPFKPLPNDYMGESLDIQFTFDYNVQ